MAGTAADRGSEHARARALESNTFHQGRAGGKVPIRLGPAYKKGVLPTNPVSGGGVNRKTRGMR